MKLCGAGEKAGDLLIVEEDKGAGKGRGSSSDCGYS
jgi:hypothetical protein